MLYYKFTNSPYLIGLWMVGVERQAQNRERMLRAMESGGDADSGGEEV